MTQVEFKGGPMDGDRLPVGYVPRSELHIESRQCDEGLHDLMHVYVQEDMTYRYEGLALLAPGPIAPLRIGERLA